MISVVFGTGIKLENIFRLGLKSLSQFWESLLFIVSSCVDCSVQIVQIVSFNEVAILQSIKAAVGSAAAARSRSNLTHGSSPYTSAGRFIKLSLEVLFNWCVLTEVGLRIDPSAFPRSGGAPHGVRLTQFWCIV